MGFGVDGSLGSSRVVAIPKFEEGCVVPGALQSMLNLRTVGAGESSSRRLEGQGAFNSGARLLSMGLREVSLRGARRPMGVV